jgi:hypothetical protein
VNTFFLINFDAVDRQIRGAVISFSKFALEFLIHKDQNNFLYYANLQKLTQQASVKNDLFRLNHQISTANLENCNLSYNDQFIIKSQVPKFEMASGKSKFAIINLMIQRSLGIFSDFEKMKIPCHHKKEILLFG